MSGAPNPGQLLGDHTAESPKLSLVEGMPPKENEENSFQEKLSLIDSQAYSDDEVADIVTKLVTSELDMKAFSSQSADSRIWYVVASCIKYLPDFEAQALEDLMPFFNRARQMLDDARKYDQERELKEAIFETIDQHDSTDLLRIIQQVILTSPERKVSHRMKPSQQRVEAYRVPPANTTDLRPVAVEAFRHMGAIFMMRDKENLGVPS